MSSFEEEGTRASECEVDEATYDESQVEYTEVDPNGGQAEYAEVDPNEGQAEYSEVDPNGGQAEYAEVDPNGGQVEYAEEDPNGGQAEYAEVDPNEGQVEYADGTAYEGAYEEAEGMEGGEYEQAISLPFYEASENISSALMTIKENLEIIENLCEEGSSCAGASRAIITAIEVLEQSLRDEVAVATSEDRDCSPNKIVDILLAAAKQVTDRKSGRRHNHVEKKHRTKKRSTLSGDKDSDTQTPLPPGFSRKESSPQPPACLPPGAIPLPFAPALLGSAGNAQSEGGKGEEELHPELAVSALIDAEDAYIRDLYTILAFQDAVVGDKVSGVSLTPKQANRLFGNIACIGQCEEELSGAIHAALEDEYYPDAVAASYDSSIKSFCVTCGAYAENIVLAESVLSELTGDMFWDAAVADLVKNLTTVKTAEAALKLPITHIKKRKELIAGLRNALSAEDDAAKLLKQTEDALTMLEERIDRYREQSKRKLEVLANVEKRFNPKETIVRRGRSRIKSGKLAVMSIGPVQVQQKGVVIEQGAKLDLPTGHLTKSKRKGKTAEAPPGKLVLGGEYEVFLFSDEIVFAYPCFPEADKKGGKTGTPLLKTAAHYPVLSLIARACPVTFKGGSAICLHTPGGLFTLEVTPEGTERPESVAGSWCSAISQAISDRLKTVVFGMPLEALATRPYEVSEWSVPLFIEAATEYIEVEGLDEEGIFRLSASASVMTELIAEIDGGGVPSFVDAHSAANIIKRWLRDSPTSLLQDELIPKWNMALRTQDPAAVRNVFFELRPFNRATAATIFSLLKKVMDNTNNLMSGNNIGIVVGVNLLKDSGVGTRVTEYVLDNYDAVLGETIIDKSCHVEIPKSAKNVRRPSRSFEVRDGDK